MSINGHRCNDTEVSVSFKSNSHRLYHSGTSILAKRRSNLGQNASFAPPWGVLPQHPTDLSHNDEN